MTIREYPVLPIPGVAAVVFHNGNVLLTRRGNEPGRGRWGIPGGVMEVGETAAEAVMREVYEETRIKVKPEKVLQVYDSINRDPDDRVRYHYTLIEYLCSYIGGEIIAGSDASEAMWVSLDDLSSIDITDGTRRFITRVAREVGLI